MNYKKIYNSIWEREGEQEWGGSDVLDYISKQEEQGIQPALHKPAMQVTVVIGDGVGLGGVVRDTYVIEVEIAGPGKWVWLVAEARPHECSAHVN